MTKLFNYFIFALLAASLASCDEEKDSISGDVSLNAFEVLKSHKWAVEDAKVEHLGNIVDLQESNNGTFPFCSQDNYYSFIDGGEIENLDLGDICLDATTHKALIDGNWLSVNQSDSLLIINSKLEELFGSMSAPSETKIKLNLIYDFDWMENPYHLKLSLFSVEDL